MSTIPETLQSLLNTEEPAQLGPGRRASALGEKELNDRLDRALAGLSLDAASSEKVRSLLLLWHDHLDASHNISQSLPDTDGSFLHGIMHRREPDHGNAGYWFRRAGRHPVFPELAERVQSLSGTEANGELAGRLAGSGDWDSLAMNDACEAVSGKLPEDPEVRFLRGVQRLEFERLLAYFCRSLSDS